MALLRPIIFPPANFTREPRLFELLHVTHRISYNRHTISRPEGTTGRREFTRIYVIFFFLNEFPRIFRSANLYARIVVIRIIVTRRVSRNLYTMTRRTNLSSTSIFVLRVKNYLRKRCSAILIDSKSRIKHTI